MTNEQAETIRACAAASLAGTIHFGEVVMRLQGIGVERYHADYSRHESTYYLPDGSSLVVPVPHPPHAIAMEFSAAAVEASIRQSQRGEIKYSQFVEQTCAAGCVGYFVHLTGRRVIYFGRQGEQHVEPFPAGK